MNPDFATSPIPASFLIEILLAIIAMIGGAGLIAMRMFAAELKKIVADHGNRILVLETEHNINHAQLVDGGRREYDKVKIPCENCTFRSETKHGPLRERMENAKWTKL